MNILWLTLGAPFPPDTGVRIRDYNLIRQVAKKHAVTLLSLLYSNEEIASLAGLKPYCLEVDHVVMDSRSPWDNAYHLLTHFASGRPLATHPFYYPEMVRKIRSALMRNKPDIVQIEHSFLAPYITAIDREDRCRTVLSLHNIGSRQYGSMRWMKTDIPAKALWWLKWLAMLGWEAKWANRFDRVVTVSAVERDLFLRANPKLRIAVVPNGCDTTALQPLPEPATGNTVLYVGTLGYPPNVDAVLYFTRNILPLIQQKLSDVQFVVVGHRPPEAIRLLAERGEITLASSVTDVLPYYRQAKVCVVPLRAGGGTRIKILEAMALGRPVVSTSLGCEGLEVDNDQQLMIADTPGEFAEAVVHLLNDSMCRHRLSSAARRFIESKHDWSTIGAGLLHLYERLLGSGG